MFYFCDWRLLDFPSTVLVGKLHIFCLVKNFTEILPWCRNISCVYACKNYGWIIYFIQFFIKVGIKDNLFGPNLILDMIFQAASKRVFVTFIRLPSFKPIETKINIFFFLKLIDTNFKWMVLLIVWEFYDIFYDTKNKRTLISQLNCLFIIVDYRKSPDTALIQR